MYGFLGSNSLIYAACAIVNPTNKILLLKKKDRRSVAEKYEIPSEIVGSSTDTVNPRQELINTVFSLTKIKASNLAIDPYLTGICETVSDTKPVRCQIICAGLQVNSCVSIQIDYDKHTEHCWVSRAKFQESKVLVSAITAESIEVLHDNTNLFSSDE